MLRRDPAAAARFSARRSFSVFCAFFLSSFFGFSEPFIATAATLARRTAGWQPEALHPLTVVAVAIAGLVVLTAVRYMTRPLWRQDHGASFRRYPTPPTLAEKRANRERLAAAAVVPEQPAS